MSLSKTQIFLFFESGNYVQATRFFTEFQVKCRNFRKIAFDHCKTCSERFVIWRDNFSFIFQRKEDKEMLEKRCYTVQELQEILGVSRSTIYNRCWWSRFGTSGKSIGKSRDAGVAQFAGKDDEVINSISKWVYLLCIWRIYLHQIYWNLHHLALKWWR